MCRGRPERWSGVPAPSGVESGEGCPIPSRLKGLGRRELPEWGPGEAPAANAYSAYSRAQNASRRKKNVIMM